MGFSSPGLWGTLRGVRPDKWSEAHSVGRSLESSWEGLPPPPLVREDLSMQWPVSSGSDQEGDEAKLGAEAEGDSKSN